MSGDHPYHTDASNELTLEWVTRELTRISDAITVEQLLEITPLTSSDSPYTVQTRDKVILADPTSGAITINLPVANNQRMIYIKSIPSSGSNAVTVTPEGTDDIDRTGLSWILTSMTCIKIIYSEAEAQWFII